VALAMPPEQGQATAVPQHRTTRETADDTTSWPPLDSSVPLAMPPEDTISSPSTLHLRCPGDATGEHRLAPPWVTTVHSRTADSTFHLAARNDGARARRAARRHDL